MAGVPKILEEPEVETPSEAMKRSEVELKQKYPGLKPKVKTVAQRKISSGGTQYFDSGDYVMQASRQDKLKIALNPKPVFNPALARLQGGGGKPPVSKLAAMQKPHSSLTVKTTKIEQ